MHYSDEILASYPGKFDSERTRIRHLTEICPSGYIKARHSYQYSPDEIFGSWAKVLSSDAAEEREPKDKTIEENCGRKMNTAVCPSDREGAGHEYAYPEFDARWKSRQNVENTDHGLMQAHLEAVMDPTPLCLRV